MLVKIEKRIRKSKEKINKLKILDNNMEKYQIKLTKEQEKNILEAAYGRESQRHNPYAQGHHGPFATSNPGIVPIEKLSKELRKRMGLEDNI